MANTEALKKDIATVETRDLRSMIEKSAKELARALPAHLSPERLVRIALTCIRQNAELSRCTPESFMGSLFVAAQLGLEPVAGMAYILPFNNKRKINGEWTTVKEAQFVVGYKGLATLFYRHERGTTLDWGIVHANDDFQYEHGTAAFLRHRPATKNRGEVLGYYAIAGMTGGGRVFRYMSKEECIEHGMKHSKTYDRNAKAFYASSPWATCFDAMALKTVLIQLSKLLPLSIELQRAIEADETSRDYRSGVDDALDLHTTTEWTAPPAETVTETAQESAPNPDPTPASDNKRR
jgi:recombination protein RecT